MDRSDYHVISQCNTLKRSILLCIHYEVRFFLLVCFAGIAFSFLETWPVSELKGASGKQKCKHCSKRISQEQEEKENSKKSRPFKQMPPRRASVFLLSLGINTRRTTLPPCWIYFIFILFYYFATHNELQAE